MTTQNQRSKSRRTKKSRKASLAADKARADRQDLKLQQLTEKRRIREIEQRKYAAEGTSFFAVETDVRKEVRDAGHLRLLEKLSGFGTGFEGNSRVCPKCGAQQHFKENVDRTIYTEFGEIPLKRAYYVCPKCGHGCYPLDEKLGLREGELQGKLREIATMQSILMPYESSNAALKRIYDQDIDPKTLQRLVDREGEETLAEDHEEERQMSLETTEGGAKTQEAVAAATAPARLYLGVDGIMTPTRETRRDDQDQGHREAKVLRIFADEDRVEVSRDRREILKGDMAGRVCNATEFRAMVHCRFVKAGGHTAKEVIGLGDGAPWVWNTIGEVAPTAIQILDFMHLMGYINDAVVAGYGEDEKPRHEFADRMATALKESQIDFVLRKLESLPSRKKADREVIERTVQYIIDNRGRMDYKTYRAKGYDIGSGTIESTGKRLVGQRLKGCGMRWNRESANAMIAIRSRWYTNRWDASWSAPRALAA